MHCVSTRGIAFCRAFEMCATNVFHVCHVELVANLYHTLVTGTHAFVSENTCTKVADKVVTRH